MKYAFQILICVALLVACKNETAKTPSAFIPKTKGFNSVSGGYKQLRLCKIPKKLLASLNSFS